MNVRDATIDVLRRTGMTTVFANPGSTEVPFLADFPDDLDFVLALHEGSVVGMATGWAIGRRAPALVLLHTTAGFGNAVSALATARLNRAPLVVLVGQQDRRHLASEPFLTGQLDGLGGVYPVWVDHPVRAQNVPGAVARAMHEATTGRGPAMVVVPMDDWSADAERDVEPAAAQRVLRAARADDKAIDALAAMLDAAARPALVAGAGNDDDVAWAALVALAERLRCPVYQEAFGARAGFPQDHPEFAGFLAATRPKLRAQLAAHDAVIVFGAPAFRQFPYTPGRLIPDDTRVAVVTEDPAEAHRSPAELAIVASPAAVCAALVDRVTPAEPDADRAARQLLPARPAPPADDDPLRAEHVLAALGERLAPDTIVVEETPSSRSQLHRHLPARTPLGFLGAAMGGLGFALPAAAGLRMADPQRPVVAVLGDGSSLYQIQGLWSAVRYRVGVLHIVMVNRRYAVMDRIAELHGGAWPWPSFEEVDVAGLARAFGCPAQHVVDHDELLRVLDEIVPTLADRTEPFVLAVEVAPDLTLEE